jgi:hypothetical protein
MDELEPKADPRYRATAGEMTREEVLNRASGQPVEHAIGARSKAVDERLLPSFFVIGPPRTGSTWLHEVLNPHTLLPNPSKETRFFDNHFQRGVHWYVSHYKHGSDLKPGAKKIGEIAPTYFASSAARERMAETVPSAKIVCVFRHPVERLVSLYRLKRAYGLIPWSFAEAIEHDPELIESGKYASTLKLWQRSFGANRVMVGLYDDLRASPQTFVDAVVDFIGVPRFKLANAQHGRVHDSENMTHPRNYFRTRSALVVADWFKARRLDPLVAAFKRSRFRKLVLGGGPPFPPMPAATLAQLEEKFRPEVDELEEKHQGCMIRSVFARQTGLSRCYFPRPTPIRTFAEPMLS